MSRNSDSFPMFITYLDGLPKCLRQQIYDLVDVEHEVNVRGQILLRPLFEKIKRSILAADYGADDDRSQSPDIAAKRCMALRNLISICK